ncbi:MAG: FAD-binding oxidoreductase [Gammaproteobacteria bacterium]|nr:FAD-binding oxidoreductase [Gammaproteobacteria bacterium]
MTDLAYEQKKQNLSAQLQRNSEAIRLEKTTSNLFRTRDQAGGPKLDVRSLNQVLEVDAENRVVEVEGMTTYAQLADACLAQGCMPLVVPQLKSITIGGAVSGIGIESTSFRHGLPHESIESMEVLLADGEVVTCTPGNEHSELFFGIPNSYGTLGYILKLTTRTMPVEPFVKLEHVRYTDIEEYFLAVEEACNSDVDFVDGSIFNDRELYLTLGRFAETAPYTSDYTWLKMYFRSIRERHEDYLSVHDYIWRWDTDWFWCSKNLFVQNLPMRLILGPRLLNSITYQKVMRWNNRTGLTATINKLLDRRPEGVVQDVDIPIAKAADFLRFFVEEIGIRPVWMCPIGGHDPTRRYPLYPLHGDGLFVNFGFWDIVPNPEKYESGYFNRKIEAKVQALGGVKSLYSDAYYDEDRFWQLYDGELYFKLKQKYDPQGRLKNLYQKCVLKQ